MATSSAHDPVHLPPVERTYFSFFEGCRQHRMYGIGSQKIRSHLMTDIQVVGFFAETDRTAAARYDRHREPIHLASPEFDNAFVKNSADLPVEMIKKEYRSLSIVGNFHCI